MRSRLAILSLAIASAACHPRTIAQLGVTAPCLETEAGEAGRNACRDAIATNPGQPKLHTRLAASHVALGQDAAALAELEHAIRLDPQNFEAHYGAGMVQRNQSSRSCQRCKHNSIGSNARFRDSRRSSIV